VNEGRKVRVRVRKEDSEGGEKEAEEKEGIVLY